MHDLSTKFQVSECNIVIFMHIPRYALDVSHHAVDTLATARQNSLSFWHTLLLGSAWFEGNVHPKKHVVLRCKIW